MYAYISQALARERVRDLQNESTWAHRARQARLARRAQRARPARESRRVSPGGHASPQAALGNVQPPDSFEDFLCQTAECMMREPTATGRAHGQTVR